MVHTKAWSHSHQGHGQTSGVDAGQFEDQCPQLAHATVEDTRCTDLKCIDSGAGEDWLFPKGHYDIASWLFQKIEPVAIWLQDSFRKCKANTPAVR